MRLNLKVILKLTLSVSRLILVLIFKYFKADFGAGFEADFVSAA